MAGATHEPAAVGPYRLVQRLGEGGMGVVHLGLDPQGKAVAVKVLRAHIAGEPEARRRLAREVQTLQRLRHPRVASVIDADVEGDLPYLVTQFVPGRTLDSYVREHGALSCEHVARIGKALAEALTAIHAVGVVHRDVKPANVMLVDGEPVLIDFGIAHLVDESRITVTGLVMGTPGYLSPEVLDGQDVTPATDWWGWGSTLAFAATGRTPFGQGPVEAVLTRVHAGTADLTGIDSRLSATLSQALTVDPGLRPAPSTLVAGLDAIVGGGPTAADDLREQVTKAVPFAPATAPTTAFAADYAPDARQGAKGTQDANMQRVQESAPVRDAHSQTPQIADPPTAATVSYPMIDEDPGRTAVYSPPPIPSHPYGDSAHPYDEAPWGPTAVYGADDAHSPYRLPPPPPVNETTDFGAVEPGPNMARRLGGVLPDTPLPILVGVFVALTLMASVAPGATVIIFWIMSTGARTSDRFSYKMSRKRSGPGHRSGGSVLTAVTLPWQLAVSGINAAASMLLPLLVGASVAFMVGTSIQHQVVSQPSDPVTLMAAAVGMIITAWVGPGHIPLRNGAYGLIAPVCRSSVGHIVALGLLIMVALSVLLTMDTDRQPDWTPFRDAPVQGI
jgi:serine/threonine protein kinase